MVLIAETGPVTERLRVREIDDDDGSRLVRILRRAGSPFAVARQPRRCHVAEGNQLKRPPSLIRPTRCHRGSDRRGAARAKGDSTFASWFVKRSKVP